MSLATIDHKGLELTITLACLSDAGLVRRDNSDAFIVTDLTEAESLSSPGELSQRMIGKRGLLLAVADGMGDSRSGGEAASQIAVRQLARRLFFTSNSETIPVSERLREAVRGAYREIRRARYYDMKREMGTTITAAVIQDHRVIIGHIGDSRCYLIRAGQIQQLTKDESMLQALIDGGVLDWEEAEESPMCSALLKSLGAKEKFEPDVNAVRLMPGDYLLLCTDGLSSKVGNVEIHDIVREAETLKAACVQLIALANDRGGEGNITLVIARFDGAGLSEFRSDHDRRIKIEHL